MLQQMRYLWRDSIKSTERMGKVKLVVPTMKSGLKIIQSIRARLT